ncbi:MAG: Uma2 family endonuclease [Pyrinomonadaceae bacterium MAG19_C2-C3]|nr:Uma2 family endonuclease [Pyrinomonadaceae bacterium MAG19_C2-C3]
MSTILEPPSAIKEPTPQHSETADDVLVQSAPETYRITVAEYHKMIEANAFNETARLELIKGVLIKMSPKGKRHAATTDHINKVFYKLLGERVIVRNQNPILFDDSTEPEPDIALLVPREKEYFDRLPTPADVLLIIEVSDTTLKYDRDTKSLLYAKSGISQYIVLNVKTREITDMREPSSEGYRYLKTLRSDERFNLVAFPEVEIKVGDLLPPE